MDIIEEVMSDNKFSTEEKMIVKRMIHTTGDFDYRKIIVLKNDFINIAKDSIESGGTIFTDTKMAYSGINKSALSKTKCNLKYFIDDEKNNDGFAVVPACRGQHQGQRMKILKTKNSTLILTGFQHWWRLGFMKTSFFVVFVDN